jgi:predicted RND superfamily exporter protein
MVHRYLEEGSGSIRKVIRSTGEHITVSAVTTMFGFSGLFFSSHPGMRTIGELAVTGIGLMLLASLILLPATIQLYEKYISRGPRTNGLISKKKNTETTTSI